jgi:hypothetical protein
MKADMSPEAIGQRLRIMGELWELSVALMDSHMVEVPENARQEMAERRSSKDRIDEGQNRER